MIKRIVNLFKRKNPARDHIYQSPLYETMDDNWKVLRKIEALILRDRLATVEVASGNYGKVCMIKSVKVIGYHGLCGFKFEDKKVYTFKYSASGSLTDDYKRLKIEGFNDAAYGTGGAII